MPSHTEWFRYQLQASADAFAWAIAQIPAHLLDQIPPEPGYLGTWSPARHVWHVTGYERCLALPEMARWADGPLPPDEDWADDDDAWARVEARDLETLVAAFRRVRQEQIDLLDRLEAVDWTAPRETGWGKRSPSWVVSKTFQHTYEHGDTLMRMGLWWGIILEEIAKAARQGG